METVLHSLDHSMAGLREKEKVYETSMMFYHANVGNRYLRAPETLCPKAESKKDEGEGQFSSILEISFHDSSFDSNLGPPVSSCHHTLHQALLKSSIKLCVTVSLLL